MKLTYSLESVLQNDFGEMTVCFGLEFQKFLSDLEFTADTDYRGYEEYPEEAFHDTLANLMEQFAEDKLELPLLFSVELDEEMSILGIPFRYMFLLADKENFKTFHECGNRGKQESIDYSKEQEKGAERPRQSRLQCRKRNDF